MKCTCCGNECYPEPMGKHPEVVFQDERNIICEECSIDYDMDGNEVIVRRDLAGIYNISLN